MIPQKLLWTKSEPVKSTWEKVEPAKDENCRFDFKRLQSTNREKSKMDIRARKYSECRLLKVQFWKLQP